MVFLVIPASFGAALLLTASLNWLALIPWRRSAGQHWTERARRLWPVRVGAALTTLWVTASCILATGMFWRDDLLALWLAGGFSWLGAVLGGWFFDREILPAFTFPDWLRQKGVLLFLHYSWQFMIFFALAAMPETVGWPIFALAGLVLALNISLHAGSGAWCLRKFGILCPPPERLARIVAASAQELKVIPARVTVFKGIASYAAALPMNRELLFSQRLLDLHPDEEISAICAHEMGHLAESRRVLAGRILGSLTLYPVIFMRPGLNAPVPFNFLFVAAFALWIVGLMQFARRLARKMEVRADEFAKVNETVAGTYARALERLYEANRLPAVMRGNRMAHPHLYDRLLAAGVTPDYPRPKPPGRWAWNSILSLALLVLLLVLGYGWFSQSDSLPATSLAAFESPILKASSLRFSR